MQIEVLLSPVINFLSETGGDASYTVGVLSLILNCIQLSSRPGILRSNNCICQLNLFVGV